MAFLSSSLKYHHPSEHYSLEHHPSEHHRARAAYIPPWRPLNSLEHLSSEHRLLEHL